MTLEAWVNPTSLSGWRAVLVKEQTSDLVYSLYADSDTNDGAGVFYNNGAEHAVRGGPLLPLGSWTHLATTYDGTTLRFYVNGSQVASIAYGGPITTSSGALRIGGDSMWGEYFNGLIDEMRIYNYALSASQIQTDMNTPLSQPASPPPSDTTPPSAPGGFASTGSSQSSISTSWSASTDNVGVAGYDLYVNGNSVGTTGGTSYTFSGLACGTSYTLAVDAFDAAGNRSAKTQLTAATGACSASGANWYLSPTGSDLNPCTQQQPCASIQRAYNLASPGQVVELAGGSYPGQSVSGSRSSGPSVIFRPASGAAVTIASIDMYADWIEIRDVTVNGLATWGTSDHATFRNVNDHSRIYIAGSSNLSIIGGSVGPYVDAQSWLTHDNGVIPTNILIQGVHFHDFTVSNSTIHTECMLVIAGNGLTFDGDTWTNCAIFDLSFGYCCSSPAQPTNVTIENNFFGTSIQDTAGTTLQFNTNLNPVNYSIRYNSSGGGGFVLDQGQSTFQNVTAIGNAEPGPYNCGRVQWSYNVFTGNNCAGTGNKVVSSLGFLNPGAGDFHLVAGAPEINAGDPSSYPATDWDGQARPMGGAPDAGADEAG
jgi:chitodextrinase